MRAWIPLGVVLAASFAGPVAAHASDAGLERDAEVDSAVSSDAEVVHDGGDLDAGAALALGRMSADVRALAAGELAASIDPRSLFDISPSDEDAVRVDAERLRVLLREVDLEARSKPSRAKWHVDVVDAGVEPDLWHARIELDRARLAFYELPEARRSALLSAHELLQHDAEAPPTEAQTRDGEAEEQRQAALTAAQNARSEAARLVSTELARLLDVEHAQTAFGERLAKKSKEIAEGRDVTIGWQQRAIDAEAHPGPSADHVYDELRRELRSAREALSQALDELAGPPSGIPAPGPDPLADLHVVVDTAAARAERDRVAAAAGQLGADEQKLRRERAAQLFDEIDTLNRARLEMLGALSPEKRAAVTGFTASGWDQATSEARQLTLILRYHRHVIGDWLVAFRHPIHALGGALEGGAVQALEWVFALGLFVWWRRRSTPLLRLLHRRAADGDRRERLSSPSPATRALAFFAQVHRPIEWLVLLLVLRWLLPAATQQILEVSLLSVLVTWIFGAALAVDAINAFAGTGKATKPRGDEPDRATLRLQSLRFVGRVVVTFGLVLVISSMLVGRGTIYHWVFSTCWLASIPVALILVRWWRATIIRRTERVRRPVAIQRWVLENDKRWWTSFAAAAVGGLYLFVSGGLGAYEIG